MLRACGSAAGKSRAAVLQGGSERRRDNSGETDKGNCLLFRTNGQFVSVGDMMIPDWLMLRRSITGEPTLNFSRWLGIPDSFRLSRNFVGYMWSMLFFVIALHAVSLLSIYVDVNQKNWWEMGLWIPQKLVLNLLEFMD